MIRLVMNSSYVLLIFIIKIDVVHFIARMGFAEYAVHREVVGYVQLFDYS